VVNLNANGEVYIYTTIFFKHSIDFRVHLPPRWRSLSLGELSEIRGHRYPRDFPLKRLCHRVLIYHMSKLSMLRILPLLALITPLTALALESAPIPMSLGKKYTGSLTPSPSNPHGEICYGLSVDPATRITMNVKTGGVGIIKFALYDKSKGLRFFHNNVNNQKSQSDEKTLVDSRFSFPAVSDVSQLCLTTSNPNRAQSYNFTVTGKPGRRAKSRPIVLRPVASDANANNITKALRSDPPAKKPLAALPSPPTLPSPPPLTIIAKPPAAPPVNIPPPPTGEPYCYVGSWQVADLSAYWLPSVQTFTQAKITDPQMLGYAKVTLYKDGGAVFEAFDLEQKYTLKSPQNGARIDKIGLGLSGTATARFQVNSDSTLTFSSQNYQRLANKLNLGSTLKLTGEKLFIPFGDRDLPAAKSAYKCLDRDNITMRIPLPTGQKSITVLLKRIN
jgi:hypothetical protein